MSLIDAINEAEAVLITAGAGMGVDSGLPDFRGNEGFWKAYPPMKRAGLSFMEMANPEHFIHSPSLAWGFYGHRLGLYRTTQPHEGFYALLHYVKNCQKDYFIFTSNVDGQFQKAGFDAHSIMECHGSIHHLQCTHPCCSEVWSAESIDVSVDETTFLASDPLPHCPFCDEIARPNILMFGDWSWLSFRTDTQEERLHIWLRERADTKLLIVEIGAGLAVPTVRHFSEQIFKRTKNSTLIRLNLREAHGPKGGFYLAKSGLEGLIELFG